MTWKFKERPRVGGTKRAEYLCPVHGRFVAEVSRDEDPDEVPCAVVIDERSVRGLRGAVAWRHPDDPTDIEPVLGICYADTSELTGWRVVWSEIWRDFLGGGHWELPTRLMARDERGAAILEFVARGGAPAVCGRTSPWSPSGITSRVRAGEVEQGKVMEYGSPDRVLDTRPLADGMPLHEWKAQRAKVHRDIALSKMRQMTGRSRKVML